MGNNIRSSSSPKALAPSIPMPPLADAMDAVHLSLSVDRFCLLAGVEALAGHCQTNWMGPVEPTIEGSQTASWRHSAKAAERLSLKLPRL